MFDLDDLIKTARGKIKLPLKDADVLYYPNFICKEESDAYYDVLFQETDWQQDPITLFGKTYPQPRLTALYGNNGKAYSYSGITMQPKPFTSVHKKLLERLKKVSDSEFTTLLLNLYRDGQDSNGWHSDDEKELGNNPVIASLSFGTPRVFHFKHKKDKNERYKLTLEHGSLLLMEGSTQHFWQHQLPKTKKVQEARINLTFRKIY